MRRPLLLTYLAFALFPISPGLQAQIPRSSEAAGLKEFDLFAHERGRVLAQADKALTTTVRTITMARNPRSAGGSNDFSSEGDYWWPDPKNPDGPYIQRDGLTNPDNFVAHRQFLAAFVKNVDALAAAYRLTKEEKYAEAAVKRLDAWFINKETRMNPNLLYAQAIKGRETGRSIGVIDTLHLAETALAVEHLRGSNALTPEIEKSVLGWFKDYMTWMRTHEYGIKESQAENNHGTCWTLQVACFAHLLGDKEAMDECRKRLKELHLPNQMAADGSFPREMRRTKPYGYAIFNLDVMVGLAVVLSTPEENLLTWSLPDGRSVMKGIEFLAPYMTDKKAWLTVKKPAPIPEAPKAGYPPVDMNQPKDQLLKPDVMYWDDWPVRQPFLIFGALTAGRADWLEAWKKLDADPKVEEIRRNFPIREPVLWVK